MEPWRLQIEDFTVYDIKFLCSISMPSPESYNESISNNMVFDDELVYIPTLYNNLLPYVWIINALDPWSKNKTWIECYLLYILAQTNLERSLQLSPVQEYSLCIKNPHNMISRHFKIKYSLDAYKSLQSSSNIVTILEDIFRVAAGDLRYEEIARTTTNFEFENSLIVVYRSYFQPVTMCIHLIREDMHTTESEAKYLQRYSYCLNVLSADRFLCSEEISQFYRKGIENNAIVDIPGEKIVSSIYDLFVLKKGVIVPKILNV